MFVIKQNLCPLQTHYWITKLFACWTVSRVIVQIWWRRLISVSVQRKLHFNMMQQLCFTLSRLSCCHCRCAKEARGDIGMSWHISSCALWAQPFSRTVKQALPHHGAKEFKFKCWEEFCAWVLSEHLGLHCYATVRSVVLRLFWTSICTCALLQASITVWCICVAESAPHFSHLRFFLWVFSTNDLVI